MVNFQAIFIAVILISKCLAVPSEDMPSTSLDGKSRLKELKSQLGCLRNQVALPGAHYVKSVEVGDAVKKKTKKKKKGADKVAPTIAIIGNVDIVLKGAMGHQREWDVNSVGIAGIGAATLNKWSAVGEAIFVNGMAVIRPSDNGTADYYHTKTSDKFRTQFSAFVTHAAKKDGDFMVNYPVDGADIKIPLVNFPINGSMFISDFYSRIYTAVGKHPYCYAGLAQFANLEAIALSMAPVYNEPLFGENKKKYYARPVEKLPGSFALIVGCAANYLDLEDNPKLEAKMKMLLYKNPFDTGRPQAEFHGHAVTLKRCVSSIEEIKAEDVGEAFHMVNTARIKTANVQVYVLKSADQMVSINDTKGLKPKKKNRKKLEGSVPVPAEKPSGLNETGVKDRKDSLKGGMNPKISGEKNPLAAVTDQIGCLALQVSLSGAHYIKAVDIAGMAKKAFRMDGADKVSPTIAIIGNVDIVLRGAMGHQREWEVNSVGIAGIGAATLDKWSAVGEAIFVNGMAVIRPSDNGTADYYHTKTSDKFRTQFSAFVTHAAEKDGDFMVNYPIDGEGLKVPLVNFPINGSMFISDFYSRIYTAVGKHPYCYAGLAQFANLEAIALSMAPVYNEPLFGENKKKYYARPVEKLPGSFALIVGCAANYLDLEDNPKLEAMMKMLLYKNPFDTGRPQAEFHGHAVTLKRCVTSIDDIKAEDVGEAYHMVNTARIRTAKVQVYVLKSAEQMIQINDTKGLEPKHGKKLDDKLPSPGDKPPGLDGSGFKGAKGHGFGGGKSPVSSIKDLLGCLTTQISLPGAHYIKAVDLRGEAKKAFGVKKDDKVSPTIAIIGNVDIVLRGAMGHLQEWDVNSVGIAGIGAATLNNWTAVGEAIFVNGMAIIRPSDNGTADYYKTKTSDKFRTQFSAFVTHDAKKDGDFMVNYPIDGENIKVPLVNFPINGSMFISDFYSRIYTAVGKHPYCYAGLAQFSNLEAIALSMAPVYNEPLFGENKKKYYARPVEKLPGSFALIIGCAANYLDLEDNPKLEAMMKMLLYKNPFDTGRPQAEFHGHAVTLKRCVTSIEDIKVEDVGEAYHMVNTARIKTAKVAVYVMKSADQMISINDTTSTRPKDKKFDGKFPAPGEKSPGLDKDGKGGLGGGFGGKKPDNRTKEPVKPGLGRGGFGGGKDKDGDKDKKDDKEKDKDKDDEEKRSTLGELIWHITHLNFTGLF